MPKIVHPLDLTNAYGEPMTMELTRDVLIEIETRIASDWGSSTGCRFTVKDGNGIAWDVTVYPSHKWDCWATKHGTLGKTRKTFARFVLAPHRHPHIRKFIEHGAGSASN